ncbi:MAG: hypothetical protein GY694_07175 [Gammaproteobacteria bacterium]|nr:hypothetical protein [Gammaproteobacteria bacterium]
MASITSSPEKRYRIIGLRGKLLLATLVVFILPLAGLSYLKELELVLKNNHSESMLIVANTISSVFRDNASLIKLNELSHSKQQSLYCHKLVNKKYIDGYSDDWFDLQNQQQSLSNNISQPIRTDKEMSFLCANDDSHYYFLISINDKSNQQNTQFGQVNFIKHKRNNTVIFQYLNYSRKVQKYEFTLNEPGAIIGKSVHTIGKNKRIDAQWQENKQGFNLELKVPSTLINHYLSFKLKNTNTQEKNPQADKQAIFTEISTDSFLSSSLNLNPIIQTDPLSTLRLNQLVPNNTRLWILSTDQFIHSKTGTPHQSNKIKNEFSLLSIYRNLYLVLMNYPEQQSFYGEHQARIVTQEIQKTLTGISSTDWLDSPHNNTMVLSVTTPIYDNDNKVIGTLVLEQNNATLLALQDKTFERILFLTLILFFSVLLTLLFFSTRLLKRIINLRNDTNLALSKDGVISNQLYRNDNDEVGDLARSFSSLLARIDQNNQYLRSLSGKLSHELRTPLTIIKSSLENMEEQSLTPDNQKYTHRANEGCARISDLLNRMSEANRLEQSIESIEKEEIDLINFLGNYIDSLQLAHPAVEINFKTGLKQLHLVISPDLIAQLLDKVFSNAISFHRKNTPITLRLGTHSNEFFIEINNFGDVIEANKLESIFSSLTSYRLKNTNNHLGIGLYICRLIAQFHEGNIKAVNNKDNQSVSFIINIPIKNKCR